MFLDTRRTYNKIITKLPFLVTLLILGFPFQMSSKPTLYDKCFSRHNKICGLIRVHVAQLGYSNVTLPNGKPCRDGTKPIIYNKLAPIHLIVKKSLNGVCRNTFIQKPTLKWNKEIKMHEIY